MTYSLTTLIEHLRAGDTPQRWTAYALLPTLDDPMLLPALIGVLQDGDVGARWRAAQLIGWLGDTAGVDALVRALHDDVWDVRFSAVWALAQLRQAAPLREVFHSERSEEQVRFVSASGLCASADAETLRQAVSGDDERLWRAAQAALANERERSTHASL